MPQYHKLVRDSIPEIIKNKGQKAVTHIAEDKEYWQELLTKLQEEVEEFGQEPSPEELSDILEVINAIADFQGYDREELEQIRQKKQQERGGFEKRIILERVEE